jgi:hypothetical protein
MIGPELRIEKFVYNTIAIYQVRRGDMIIISVPPFERTSGAASGSVM